jgi:ABC-type microcin C transport system permease subunit YejE
MMSIDNVKIYKKKQVQPMQAWTADTDMTGVSVSQADKDSGSPKLGDMIAFNPQNLTDRWLVAEKFLNDNYEIAR